MKAIFASLVSVLFTATAFAMPAIGDNAVYSLQLSQGGQTISGTLETTITANNAGTFSIESKIDLGGQKQVQTEQKQANELVSDALIADVMANCANYGGKIQSVTVPAGTFNACALPAQPQDGTGFTWIAPVAFGVVKVDTTDTQGQKTYAELNSFKFGQ